MKNKKINLEVPIYDEEVKSSTVKSGFHNTFTYTSFQAFLDSRFRKDLYKALNTNNYKKFLKLRFHERNIPRWLCKSIYEYAVKRKCSESIINEIKKISFRKFLTPSQISLSKGDIVGGWKVVEVKYFGKVNFDEIWNRGYITEGELEPQVLEGYILQRNVGDD